MMASSACMTKVGISLDSLLDSPPACPRISFSVGSKAALQDPVSGELQLCNSTERPDLKASSTDLTDFEFQIDDPFVTLPAADELFSGGKLVPLDPAPVEPAEDPKDEIRSPEIGRSKAATVLSPKSSRCSSRWRELLGLKQRQQQLKRGSKLERQKLASSSSSSSSSTSVLSRNPNPNPSFMNWSLRNRPKSTPSDSDSESVSLSSRRSLSSSSSSSIEGSDDILSVDSDKPSQIPSSNGRNSTNLTAARSGSAPMRRRKANPSIESPRMNSSGRVVFQGLERSSSSPGSFNGAPRIRHHGMQRSHSTGVTIRPVINVPVTFFGLGQLFSSQRKERDGPATKNGGNKIHR